MLYKNLSLSLLVLVVVDSSSVRRTTIPDSVQTFHGHLLLARTV